MYNYDIIDPRPSADNSRFLRTTIPLYGIEVPLGQAELCVDNLDPQHLGEDPLTTAIEAALTWRLPPVGATLATVRPDGDSVGAMGVLGLRAYGRSIRKDRVTLVANADRERLGPWPGPQPGKIIAEDLLGPATGFCGMCQDDTLSLEIRVFQAQVWLMERPAVPNDYLMRQYYNHAIREAQDALDHLSLRRIAPNLALVEGTTLNPKAYRFAPTLGYRYAPVVVSTNHEFVWQEGDPHRKHTVCRWNSTIPMNWEGMCADLRRREPDWGGSTSIIGSPQGVGSDLTTEEVIETVSKHLQ